MRKLAALLPLLAGCSSASPSAHHPAATPPEGTSAASAPPGGSSTSTSAACQIDTSNGHAPGWPFDLPTFRTQILPFVSGTCAISGCHQAPMGQAGFNLWADAAPGNCDYAKTFNAIAGKVDLQNPPNSPIYVAISGGDPAHPIKLPAGDAHLTALLGFIRAAAATATAPSIGAGAGAGGGTAGAGGGTSATPPPSANPFDFNVYQASIQPILDTAEGGGCAGSSCHGAPQGQAGFKLVSRPSPGSTDMTGNFNAVTAICNLQAPEQSLFYLRASSRHGSGLSKVVSSTEAATILAWIKGAQGNTAPPPTAGGTAPGTPPGGTACASPALFDATVFQTEIQPILFGTVDLNDRTSNRDTTGCARAACHGADRTGGALVLKTTNTAAQNLQSFACFVNLTNPAQSEIVGCPSNGGTCRRHPHPGAVIFADASDKNYQRILSYLYATKTAATPLDFAFFVRNINPILNDPNLGGAQNRTCSSSACHGIAVAGQAIPNGSSFGVFPNAQDKTRLTYDFSAAADFVNFVQPIGSSLFLFPTNEIADLNNPFATGLQHPGGLDFAPDSAPAQAILTWAHGLRPDAAGFQKNWLVAGDYIAAAITDPTPVDEVNAQPSIFDPSGTQTFNGGVWDGLFSSTTTVDLNSVFPRASTSGRAAYAVAYVINTTPADIQANITVSSGNAIKLYVNNMPILQASNAVNGVSGLTVFPAYGTGRAVTRLLLKVQQRATDPTFSFSTRFQDQFGNPLTDTSGELVIKLGPDGGI